MGPALLHGSVLFLAAFSIHWIHWRLRGVPGTPALAQTIHFLGFLIAYCVLRRHAEPRLDLAATALLYAGLAGSYIQAFPLALLRSPTLVLLLELGKAGERGLSRGELVGGFDAHALFGRRIEELLRSGMVARDVDGRLRSKLRGKLAVPIFIVLRRLLGLPTGQG